VGDGLGFWGGFQVTIRVRIVLRLGILTDSSFAHHSLTVSKLESDPMDGRFWQTIALKITVGKVHFWGTGSLFVEIPIEGRPGINVNRILSNTRAIADRKLG
jgi:hypothetical protein